MATIQIPNHAVYLMATGAVDWDNDTFKFALCADFTFDIDADIEYADISANELSTGGGYTAGGITMAGGTVTEDDTNNDARRAFTDITLTASGAAIGPFKVAIIYNDTLTNDPIMAALTFDTSTTIADGDSALFENLLMRLKTSSSV